MHINSVTVWVPKRRRLGVLRPFRVVPYPRHSFAFSSGACNTKIRLRFWPRLFTNPFQLPFSCRGWIDEKRLEFRLPDVGQKVSKKTEVRGKERWTRLDHIEPYQKTRKPNSPFTRLHETLDQPPLYFH